MKKGRLKHFQTTFFIMFYLKLNIMFFVWFQ